LASSYEPWFCDFRFSVFGIRLSICDFEFALLNFGSSGGAAASEVL